MNRSLTNSSMHLVADEAAGAKEKKVQRRRREEEEVLLEARVNDHVRTVAHWQSRVGLVAPLMPGKLLPGGFCRVSRCLLYRVSLDFFLNYTVQLRHSQHTHTHT